MRGKKTVRLNNIDGRTQKIISGKLFWYNDETIPRIKTILDDRFDLYQPQDLKATPKDKEAKTAINPFLMSMNNDNI